MACTLSDARPPLQALAPSAAITVVAAGMAVTAVTATALAPIRAAAEGTSPRPAAAAEPRAPRPRNRERGGAPQAAG